MLGIDENSWQGLKKAYQVCVSYLPLTWFIRIHPEIPFALYRTGCYTHTSHPSNSWKIDCNMATAVVIEAQMYHFIIIFFIMGKYVLIQIA